MTAWLIDGYNLLYAVGLMDEGSGRSLESCRSALLGFLADAMPWEDRSRTTVVFDAKQSPPGAPRRLSHRGITVRFSVGYESADAMIEQLIRKDTSPKKLVVVSSDHQIQRAAKRRRAKAIDSDVWYRQIARARRESIATAPPERPPVPLLSEDVDYWVRRFGGAAELERLIADIGRDVASERISTHRPITIPRPAPVETKPPTEETIEPKKEIARSERPPKKKKIPSRQPPRRFRRRKSRAAGEKPLQTDFTNPFPPGYAEDVIEQEGDIE